MLPSIRNLASKIGRLPGTKKPVRGMEEKSHRRLHVDPLEERQLLSISAGVLDQQMINETVTQNGQLMEGTQAIAVDNDGDFVATWMRYDTVLDQFGNEVIDPVTHEPMLDANIYARYFTDEVQRITLPQEVTTDEVPGYATFSIKYGGNEIQKLQLTQANEPYTTFDQSIVGTVTLGFDGNGDNVISASETQTFSYNEDLTLEENRTNLEAAVRQLGPKAADAVVQAVSSREYLIKFGASSNGENLPEITIESTTTFTAGSIPTLGWRPSANPSSFKAFRSFRAIPSIRPAISNTRFIWHRPRRKATDRLSSRRSTAFRLTRTSPAPNRKSTIGPRSRSRSTLSAIPNSISLSSATPASRTIRNSNSPRSWMNAAM